MQLAQKIEDFAKTGLIEEVEKSGFSLINKGFDHVSNGGELEEFKNLNFVRKKPLFYCFSGKNLCFSEKKLKNWGNSSSDHFCEPLRSKGFRTGAKSSMGEPKLEFAPHQNRKNGIFEDMTAPILNEIPSLKELRSENDSLLIGFDAEWYDEPRKILSLQFSVVWNDYVYEYVYLNPHADGRPFLKLEEVLSQILHDLEFESFNKYYYQKFKACTGFDGDGNTKYQLFDSEKHLYYYAAEIYPLFPEDTSKPLYQQNFEPRDKTIAVLHSKGVINRYAKRKDRDWKWAHAVSTFPKRHNVTIVCHAGRVDLTTLFKGGDKNWMNYTSPIQGGAVSLKSLRFDVPDLYSDKDKYKYVFPLTLNFRDTMAQAPSGQQSLAKLGDAIGLQKLDDSSIKKHAMNETLIENSQMFFEYASRDATITVLYASFIYGINKEMAVTLTSAGAKVIASKLASYMKTKDSVEFDNRWRGIKKVNKGTVKNPNGLGYLTASNKEPVTENARDVQNLAALSYHGGFNASTFIGYITEETVDFDLCSAYPTALALVRDINWENPIKQEISQMTINSDKARMQFLEKFRTSKGLDPTSPFFARVKFKFPETVKFPCIPINNEGRIITPLAFGDGYGDEHEDVVHVAGPELFLALKLGADVYIEKGYFLNTLYRNDNSDSLSMSYALKSLIQERALAKKLFPETKLWELILKTIANGSAYGKTAQNVVNKTTWNTYTHVMDDLSESVITNPVVASLTTSFVRAELFAIMNQLTSLNYKVYSVTTDGFITNCLDVEVLERLDMFGLANVAREARLFLTDNASSSIWEAKHVQNSFYNATTRGNMSIDISGVSAHNSTKTGFISGSLEDRKASLFSWLNREDRVKYRDKKWTTHKELALGASFTVKEVERAVSMDFDMKRKPIKSSFYNEYVDFNSNTFEVACFDTVAFNTISEANLYESKKKLCHVLRTQRDWDKFWLKIDNKSVGNHVAKRGLEWTKLMSCIQGARLGYWTIEQLDRTDLSLQDKLDWINSFNLSEHKFKVNNWKDARKSERLVNMLPYEKIKDFLEVLGATDFKV